jgi:hypothetical protein
MSKFRIALPVALALSGSASADFAAQFDAYLAGTRLQNVDGWKGWDNVAGHAGIVSNDFFYTGDSSLKIQGYTDAVRTFSGVSSGLWSVSAKQYIPGGQGGLSYLILMNRYVDGGNTDAGMWSTQLRFDLAAGLVHDDFRGGSVPIVTNQWGDVRVDVDLTANTVRSYYNNQLISSGSWTTSGSSARAVAAIDLYSADNNSVYYDNVSLTGVPSPGGVVLGATGLFLLLRRSRDAAALRG